MRRWLPGVLIAVTFLVSALMRSRLPEVVTFDLRLLLPVAVEGESGPRTWFAFGLPAVALVLWIFFLFATSRAGLALQARLFSGWAPPEALAPHAIARFRPTYDLVVAL